MWFRGTEFRIRILDDGKVVAFIPTDAEGKRRDALVLALRADENQDAMKVVLGWEPNDRILFYHDDSDPSGVFENGLFNQRTKEKFRL